MRAVHHNIRLLTDDWSIIHFGIRTATRMRAMATWSTFYTNLNKVPSTRIEFTVFTVSDKELLLRTHTHATRDVGITYIATRCIASWTSI